MKKHLVLSLFVILPLVALLLVNLSGPPLINTYRDSQNRFIFKYPMFGTIVKSNWSFEKDSDTVEVVGTIFGPSYGCYLYLGRSHEGNSSQETINNIVWNVERNYSGDPSNLYSSHETLWYAALNNYDHIWQSNVDLENERLCKRIINTFEIITPSISP